MELDTSMNPGTPNEPNELAQNNTTEVRPVDTADRIKTIDIIRGVGLLGILLMNIPGFGIDQSAYYYLTHGSYTSTDFYTHKVVSIFFEGTMRGLFSMLFGAGMILFTMNKKEVPGAVPVIHLYYRRLLWLLFFGVINAYVLLWWGDILFFYALCGMLLYPFRNSKPRLLIILGILCFCIASLKTSLWYNEDREKRLDYLEAVTAEKSGKKLSAEQKEAKTSWLERENWRPPPERTERNVSRMRSGYITVFTHLLPRNADDETWGTYHWAIWDCLGMMLIGMALFKIGYFSNKISSGGYTMGLLIGYGIGIPVAWLIFNKGELGQVHYGAYLDRYRVNHFTLYDVKRLFISLGHASLIMLVYRSRIVPWLMKALSNVGQMAFTNYLMQSIICTLYFHGYGLGNYNKLSYHQLYYVVLAVWIFQLIASSIWLKYYRFGPFEWLWRSLTYWKKQPMKK
ncbi:MAG: DUF418 domain-containing protein [Ferruginibacter sp.]